MQLSTGVDLNSQPTGPSSIEKLRKGIEHDDRHRTDYKDYRIDHAPLQEYDYEYYDDDDVDEQDEEYEDDDTHSMGHHGHSHMAPDGFFCNALGEYC